MSRDLRDGPLARDDHASGRGLVGAPRAAVRVDAVSAGPGEALLAFGPSAPPHDGLTFNLSPTGDLEEAAANLFAALRMLDATGAATIAVMPVPDTGLGEAINDRLTRASTR